MRVLTLVIILSFACATHAPPAQSASCSARGDTYAEAMAAKAAARAAALAAARRAEARERAARREAAQIARWSRVFGPTVARWYPLVHQYFPGHVRDALYVMRGESGGRPTASNGTCRGLFQIHECHAAAFRRITGRPYFWHVFDPEANAVMTSHMTRGGVDWSSWSVRP
jgi:hypothetical protein